MGDFMFFRFSFANTAAVKMVNKHDVRCSHYIHLDSFKNYKIAIMLKDFSEEMLGVRKYLVGM